MNGKATDVSSGPNRTLRPWILIVHQDGIPIGVCRSVCPDREHAERDVKRFAAMGLDCRAVQIPIVLQTPALEFAVAANERDSQPILATADAPPEFRTAPSRWRSIEGGESNRTVRLWASVMFKNGRPHVAYSSILDSAGKAASESQQNRWYGYDVRACEVAIELPDMTADSATVVECKEIELPQFPQPRTDGLVLEPRSWKVITRKRGADVGRTLFTTEVSRERTEQWLAEHPQPDDCETLIIDDRQWTPFPSPQSEETVEELQSHWYLNQALEMAKQGKDLELPAVERQVRNVLLAILDNAFDLNADVTWAIDELISYVQQEEGAREGIREAIQ